MVCRSGFLLCGVMKMLAQRKLNLDGKHAVLLADRRRAVILCHAVFHIPDAVPVHIAGLLPLLGRNGIVDCVKQRVVLLAQGKGDGGRIRRGYLLTGFDGVINGIAHNDVQIHRADGQLIGNPHIEIQGNPLILNLLQRTAFSISPCWNRSWVALVYFLMSCQSALVASRACCSFS